VWSSYTRGGSTREYILARYSRTHFRNMVDINDDRALVDSGAGYLVLHKVMQSIYVAFALE